LIFIGRGEDLAFFADVFVIGFVLNVILFRLEGLSNQNFLGEIILKGLLA